MQKISLKGFFNNSNNNKTYGIFNYNFDCSHNISTPGYKQSILTNMGL